MPKIEANGVNLHYLSVGHGRSVVMLHGFLGNLAVWHLQIAPELRSHFRVITYDLRGHGYSEVTPTGYSAADMAEDLRGLLDSFDIRRTLLVGHSFGADVCLYFAFKYPERVEQIVAIEPGLAALVDQRKSKHWEGWEYWASKLEEAGLEIPEDKRTDLDYLLKLSLETPRFYGPARGLPRRREPLLNLIRNTTLMADYEKVGELTLDAVRCIQTETLLIYGDRSHFLGSCEFLRHALPRCRTVMLHGGEHFGPLEQPGELVRHISGFFGVSAAPGANSAVHASRESDLLGALRQS